MKKLALLFPVLLLFCCKESESKDNLQPLLKTKDSAITIIREELPKDQSKSYTLDYLKMEDVLLNGRKLLLDKKDFEKMYSKIDSTQTDLWECGNPLTFLDREWMIKTYGKEKNGEFEKYDGNITTIYTHNMHFITNNHVVLFDTAEANNNTLTIIPGNITLDKNTTIEDFQKLFPKLEKETTDDPAVFRFRISTGKDQEDAFLFYFKNGKLDYTTLWFLLC